MSNTVLFCVFIIPFIVILLSLGKLTERWVTDATDFNLAGRQVGCVVNVFGSCATAYASSIIVLIIGFGLSYGMIGAWSYGVMYPILGLSLYGLVMAPYIRRCGAQTSAEYFEMRFSRGARTIQTFAIVVGMVLAAASNIAGIAGILSTFLGIPYMLTAAVSLLVIMAFMVLSGLWAVTITDFIQMAFGFVTVIMLLVFCFSKFGGLEFLNANWPGESWLTSGVGGDVLPVMSTTYPSLLTFVLLYGFFLTWGGNHYWLRIASARSEKVARNSYIISGVLACLVIFLPLALFGIYVGAANPTLFVPAGGEVAVSDGFNVLITSAPAIITVLALMSGCAASISTVSTVLMSATVSVSRDIYQSVINPKATNEQLVKLNKVLIIAVAVIVFLLSNLPGGVTALFGYMTAMNGVAAIPQILGAFWPRYTKRAATWSLLAGMLSMIFCITLEIMGITAISAHVHAGIVGLVVMVLCSLILPFVSSPQYYGKKGWELTATASNREEVELEEQDYKVLEYIRWGHKNMAEIIDLLMLDAKFTNQSIERLDRGGYIERMALRGKKFWSFSITAKGISALPKLSEYEQRCCDYQLKPLYVEYLKAEQGRPECVVNFAKANGLTSSEMGAIISHLAECGYLVERGVWRRFTITSPKGLDIVKSISEVQHVR